MNGKNKNKPNPSNFSRDEKQTENAQNESAAEKNEDSDWQKDIEKRDYYYDDSHGYEIYNPDEDDENE